jgi:hypothetical protein
MRSKERPSDDRAFLINSVDPKEPDEPRKDKEAKARYKTLAKPLFDARQSLNTYWHRFGKPGDHAEDAFLESFEQASEETDIVKTLREIFDDHLFITLKLSRSPCSVCTEKLLKFAQSDKKIHLRIKVQTLYEGDGAYQGASDIHRLIGAGVSVREWNVPLHAKSSVRTKNGVTKLGQDHELCCWCLDSDDKMQGEYREYLKHFETRTVERLSTLDEYLNKINKENPGDFTKEINAGKYKNDVLKSNYQEQSKLKPTDRSKDWFLKRLAQLDPKK